MKSADILALLPEVFQHQGDADSLLHGFLAAMETLHAPCEEILEHIERYFDPHTTDARFLPVLARWVMLGPELARGEAELRALVGVAAELARRRGTLSGLQLFLETATGAVGFEMFENVTGPRHEARAFHLRVCAPAQLRQDARLLRRIIERDKPAYLTYELDWVIP